MQWRNNIRTKEYYMKMLKHWFGCKGNTWCLFVTATSLFSLASRFSALRSRAQTTNLSCRVPCFRRGQKKHKIGPFERYQNWIVVSKIHKFVSLFTVGGCGAGEILGFWGWSPVHITRMLCAVSESLSTLDKHARCGKK